MLIINNRRRYEEREYVIEIFNKKGKLRERGIVAAVGHFGVVRDYTITLKSGTEIIIPAGIVAMVVAHEHVESPRPDN